MEGCEDGPMRSIRSKKFPSFSSAFGSSEIVYSKMSVNTLSKEVSRGDGLVYFLILALF